MATLFTRYHAPELLAMGCVKDIVCQTKISDITDLKQKITDAIVTIDEATL